ncbi:AAEL002667-PA [Aedes aegypti]|uniref:AAEL002667-PA n=1 Tax=Aedes aegypti TaxID=7159 RepID=Q17HJ7_AEDAE|nr:AAEL002667-PA [Aedes aegypti]
MGLPTMVMCTVFLCSAVFLSFGEAAAADQDKGQGQSQGQGQETCLGRNEVFVRCGTACPRTCSNRGTSSDRNCVQVCVPGCFCQRGYVRDRLWQCVRSRQCRRQESGTRSGLGPVVDDVAADGVTEVDAAVGAQPGVMNPAL